MWFQRYVFALTCISTASAQFYRTNGKDILDPEGQVFYSRGMNLNSYLDPEAFDLRLDRVHNRHLETVTSMKENIRSLLQNDDDAAAFWGALANNWISEQDVLDMAEMGFNTIRLPFNYRMISPENSPGEFIEEGFQMIDKVVGWCKNAGIALVLDMHSCPGGQSAVSHASPEYSYWDFDQDRGDWFERGVPVLWEYNDEYLKETGRTPEFNKNRTVEIWRKIAERYQGEPAILGYELINEPYYYESAGVNDANLRALYVQITNAIREVDSNHIILVEGNKYAQEVGGLLPAFDDNMVVAFHRFWRDAVVDEDIREYLDAREQHNVPFLMTESGENSDSWVYAMAQLMESNGIGWIFTGIKKVDGIVLHYEVQISEDYQYVIDNWRDSQDVDPDRIKTGLMQLAEASKSENCVVHPGYCAAMLDPMYNVESRPFIETIIPGMVYTSNYDIGNKGIAYGDTSVMTTVFQGEAWNAGWTYRNDGVDVGTTFDDNDPRSNGYHIYETKKGEWVKYTVNVDQEGLYTMTFRARNVGEVNGNFGIHTTSRNLIYLVDVPPGDNAWTDVVQSGAIYLQQGTQTLTLTMVEGKMEIAWMELVLQSSPEQASEGGSTGEENTTSPENGSDNTDNNVPGSNDGDSPSPSDGENTSAGATDESTSGESSEGNDETSSSGNDDSEMSSGEASNIPDRPEADEEYPSRDIEDENEVEDKSIEDTVQLSSDAVAFLSMTAVTSSLAALGAIIFL